MISSIPHKKLYFIFYYVFMIITIKTHIFHDDLQFYKYCFFDRYCYKAVICYIIKMNVDS